MARDPKITPISAARLQHAGENTADYLEAIADLIAEKGEARLVDIADRLGISKATANKTLSRIQREGHITSQPYRAVFLSDSGAEIAAESKRRHLIVLDFLRAAGVPEEAAQRDAEGIEHHVGEETLRVFVNLTSMLHQGLRLPNSGEPSAGGAQPKGVGTAHGKRAKP
jgi:DtxR family manganese transport transcriptional regulator